jgi:hypothetical protein
MTTKLYDCPQCNKVIGQLKTVNNVEFLNMNGVFCRELRGFCANCGAEIRFSVSDAYIRKLVERTKNQVK